MTGVDPQVVRQSRGVKFTVLALAAFIIVIVAGFVYRIQQPRVLTASEMQINGLYLMETPRNFGEVNLVDQRGEVFNAARFKGKWTLVFFGFTYCPDVCPTTMSFLNDLMGQLEGSSPSWRDFSRTLVGCAPRGGA